MNKNIIILFFFVTTLFSCYVFSLSTRQRSVRPPESLKKTLKARVSGQIEKTKTYFTKAIQPYILFYKSKFTPAKQDGMSVFMRLYYFGIFRSIPSTMPSLQKASPQPQKSGT